MKRSITTILILVILFLIWWFFLRSPEPGEEPSGPVFSGVVLDYYDKPIEEASIFINGAGFTTDENGGFSAEMDSAQRYVLNISKEGYGLISEIYYSGAPDQTYRLKRATVVTADPGAAITVTDTLKECEQRNLLEEEALESMKKTAPVLDHRGRVIDIGIPDELFESFKKYELRDNCNTGASVSIPANALSIPSGTSGNVSVSVSTIDVFSRNGMPGDWTVNRDRNTYMISFGAATVDVFYDGKPVELKKGMKATVSIPVDPLVVETSKYIPDTIPFLFYNRKSGLWEEEGYALLDRESLVYRAETSHFSEFNMDIYKVDPACIRFCPSPTLESNIVDNSDRVEVIMNDLDVNTLVTRSQTYLPGSCTTTESGCGNQMHMIYNLSPNTPMVLKIVSSASVVKSLAVLVTGDGYGAADPFSCPYDACCGGGNACEDPCTGSSLPILDAWPSNSAVLTAVKDDVNCRVTFYWYDPTAADIPGDQSGGFSYNRQKNSEAWETDWSGPSNVTQLEPGFFSGEISICDGASDIECFANWKFKVKFNLGGVESNVTCVNLLAGCPTCNPCP